LGRGTLEITETLAGRVPVIGVCGEFDHVGGLLLLKRARSALGANVHFIVFDLENCTYIDSGGVAVLLTLLDQVRDTGWVGIVNASRHVLRILEIVGLSDTQGFMVFANVAEAQERCGATGNDICS